MNKLNIFSIEGTQAGNAEFPKEFFAEGNKALLSQALHVYRDRKHPGLGYAKTRAEVDITKKKIYRQKGTGGARHGASSAHIFVGGGVAHGPKGVKRELTLPQNMRRKAMHVALTMKANDGEVVVASGLATIAKTAQAQKLMNAVRGTESKKNQKFTFVLAEYKEEVVRAIRNLAHAEVLTVGNLNAYSVSFGGIIILDEAIVGTKPEKKAAVKKVTTQTKAKK
jgi:large subunit ribosomal protein L4